MVIVWRGTWGILDHVLLPHDPILSAWVSLVSISKLNNIYYVNHTYFNYLFLQGIGYGVTAIGFAIQVPARIACEKLSGAPRLIVADTYQFFCFCGTVNLWRGVWNLLNIYLLPGKNFFRTINIDTIKKMTPIMIPLRMCVHIYTTVIIYKYSLIAIKVKI